MRLTKEREEAIRKNCGVASRDLLNELDALRADLAEAEPRTSAPRHLGASDVKSKAEMMRAFTRAAERYADRKVNNKEVQTSTERKQWLDAYAAFVAGMKFGVKYCRNEVRKP